MDTAIVILNYNNYDLTIACVKQLLWLGIKARIVIVDNGSTNESFFLIKKEFDNINNIHIIQSGNNYGYACGNNYGLKYIENFDGIKYICIMNPDVKIVTKDYLEILKENFKYNDELVIVSGIQVNHKDFKNKRYGWRLPSMIEIVTKGPLAKQKYIIPKNDLEKLFYVDVVSGACFMIKYSFFKKIGYFSTNTFLYNEENILSLKVKNMGYRIATDTTCYYEHNHVFSQKKFIDIKSRINFCKIWFSGRKQLLKEMNGMMLLPVLVINFLVHCAYFVFLELVQAIRRRNR